MKLNEAYRNILVSTGPLYVDELVDNCYRFLRSLELDDVTADRLLVAEHRLMASIYPNDDLRNRIKKIFFLTILYFDTGHDKSPFR